MPGKGKLAMSHANWGWQIKVCWIQADSLNNLWFDWLVDLNALVRKIRDGASRHAAKSLDFVKSALYSAKDGIGASQLRLVSQRKKDFTASQSHVSVPTHANAPRSNWKRLKFRMKGELARDKILGFLFSKSIVA